MNKFSKIPFAFLILLFFTQVTLGQKKPNIIVVFTDDQGYGDLGAYGQLNDIKTPNLDGLAQDGVLFTDGYVTAPQCAPSRAGLMTGKYQQRYGFDTIPDGPLPLEEVTIAERFQDLGYKTGQVGKWHLEPNRLCVNWAKKESPDLIIKNNNTEIANLNHGLIEKYLPRNQGFDEFFTGELHHYWANYNRQGADLSQKGEPITFPKSEFRVDIQTDAALSFIDRNHENPFFLYLAYYAPHVPLEASEKYLSRFPGDMPERRRTALAMMSAVDDGIGSIRNKLSDYGIDENTIIVYISDNGAPIGAQSAIGPFADVLPVGKAGPAWDGSMNTPLTGEKGMLMEGGIRVPFLISWPNKLPKGIISKKPVISLDIAATAMAAAGAKIPRVLDGINLVPYLTNSKPKVRKLYWRFWNQAAVREGKWKYFTLDGNNEEFLVNIEEDIEEDINLINKYPEIAKKLRKSLLKWTNKLQPQGIPNTKPNQEEIGFYKHYLNNK